MLAMARCTVSSNADRRPVTFPSIFKAEIWKNVPRFRAVIAAGKHASNDGDANNVQDPCRITRFPIDSAGEN